MTGPVNKSLSPAWQDFIESRAEITRLGARYEQLVARRPKSRVCRTIEQRLSFLHGRVIDLRNQLTLEEFKDV